MSSKADEIFIYAEFLPNLRQISVACHLPTPSSAATEVTVQGAHFSISHAEQTRSLQLPRPAKGSSKLAVEQGKTSLSLRFPCELETSQARIDQQNGRSIDGLWSGLDIQLGSPISCRKCKAILVPQGTLKAWDDLPSENWAEMMDFWHCHKPDDHEKHEHDDEHLTKRGYGASSRMSAKAGTAFVDLTSILVSPVDILAQSKVYKPVEYRRFSGMITDTPTQHQDISCNKLAILTPFIARGSQNPCSTCRLRDRSSPGGGRLCVLGSFLGCGNLRSIPELSELPAVIDEHDSAKDDQESQEPLGKGQNTFTTCGKCQEQLGIIAPDTASVAFFKWKVSVAPWAASTIGLTNEPNIQQFASAVCSNNSLSYGLGKTLFVPMNGSQDSQACLHIWLFSDSIFCSSTAAEGLPRAATKVFYRLLTDVKEIDKLVHAVTSDTQETSWPAESIDDLIRLLQASTLLLPPGTRGFGAWQIGLLDRWSIDQDKYRPVAKDFKYEPLGRI